MSRRAATCAVFGLQLPPHLSCWAVARQFPMEGAAPSAPGRPGWLKSMWQTVVLQFLLPTPPGGDGAPPSIRALTGKAGVVVHRAANSVQVRLPRLETANGMTSAAGGPNFAEVRSPSG